MRRNQIMEEVRQVAIEPRRSKMMDRRRRRKRRGNKGRIRPKQALSPTTLRSGEGKHDERGSPESMPEKGGEVSKEAEQEEEEEECAICMMVLDELSDEEEDEIMTLVCGHRFHGETCMEPWKDKCREKQLEFTCPLCHGPLVEKKEV